MPKPYENAPTVTRTFADVTVLVPAIFAPGHALSANEAKWANTMVGTVVGNAFGSRVRNGLKALDAERKAAVKAKKYDGPYAEDGKSPAPATLADIVADPIAAFNELYESYELGAGRAMGEGKAATDPVTTLVRTLATAEIKRRILSKGRKVKEFMDAKVTVVGEEISAFSNLVNQFIAAHPELEDTARAQLEALAQSDTSEEDEFDAAISAQSPEVSEAA